MNKLLIVLALISANSAFALPINFLNERPTEKLLDETSRHFTYDFEGIVKLDNCSGSLIKFAGQPMTSKAYILTNGHCIQKRGGYLKPGEVWSHRKLKRNMKIFKADMSLVRVTSTKIVYATMTDTDSAIYELNQTYEELANKGIRSFDLDGQHPFVGMDIDIVSGYWDRGYRCHIDAFIPQLLEGEWVFTDSIRYSEQGCDTIGGTSGSPIIETTTRRVIGINNTGNKKGGRCILNNPCEQDENGDITVMKRSYGQQTYKFYDCLTVDFQIDLSVPGCDLPK